MKGGEQMIWLAISYIAGYVVGGCLLMAASCKIVDVVFDKFDIEL